MAVIRINASGETPALHENSGDWRDAIDRQNTAEGPVVIMTHGYRLQPGRQQRCPHGAFLALRDPPDGSGCPSWPQRLGFAARDPSAGLAIAFGWDGIGPARAVYRRAAAAGRALAVVIRQMQDRSPGRPIHFIGHSMGVQLILEALHHVPAGSVGRILSLTGAGYRGPARTALATPAGRVAEFINVTSRENDFFDFLFERLIPAPMPGDRALGSGLSGPNALTLQLDCADTLSHIARIANPVAGPARRVCHWSSYTRPGVLDFYRALLRDPARLSLAHLRRGLPRHPAARWSRLIDLPHPGRILPPAKKAT